MRELCFQTVNIMIISGSSCGGGSSSTSFARGMLNKNCVEEDITNDTFDCGKQQLYYTFLYIIRMTILVILVVVAVLALATDKHPPNRRFVAHI